MNASHLSKEITTPSDIPITAEEHNSLVGTPVKPCPQIMELPPPTLPPAPAAAGAADLGTLPAEAVGAGAAAALTGPSPPPIRPVISSSKGASSFASMRLNCFTKKMKCLKHVFR